MKKLLFTLFLLVSGVASQAQQIQWMSLDEALKAQKADPKPIVMEVYTNWCGECRKMDKKTFKDAALVKLISGNYYAVKFNAEGNSEVNYKGKTYRNEGFMADKKEKDKNNVHAFTQFLKIEGYPAIVVFEEHGEISNVLSGYKSAQDLLSEL